VLVESRRNASARNFDNLDSLTRVTLVLVEDRRDSPTIQPTLVLVQHGGRIDREGPGLESEADVEAGYGGQREGDGDGEGDACDARHGSTPSVGSVIRPTCEPHISAGAAAHRVVERVVSVFSSPEAG